MTDLKGTVREVLRKMLQYVESLERHVTPEEIEEQWEDVKQRVRAEKRRMRKRRYLVFASSMTAAAVVAMVLVVTLGQDHTGAPAGPAEPQMAVAASADDLKLGYMLLRLPDNRHVRIMGDEAEISNSLDGAVTVNGHRVADGAAPGGERPTAWLSVPCGKRAKVTLADGSAIWVNSGTKLRYPLSFGSGTRSIYAEGEVYLDVAADADHPFVAETRGFDVTVHGTSFNVMAYPADSVASVVLVRGSVKVSGTGKGSVEMVPGQLVDVRGNNPGAPRNVDVEKYVSWVDRLLVYDDEPLGTVFGRLHTVSGNEFVLGKGVSSIRVSGKLDLKYGLDNVLSAISFTAPVAFEERNGKIYVNRQ